MFIHREGINHPMAIVASTSESDAEVMGLLARVVTRKRSVSGVSTSVVRDRIARVTGIAAGTLENIQRGRTKGVRGYIRDRILAYAIADTQKQIARLEHELLLARALADRSDAPAVFAAQAALAQARELLEGR